MGLIEWWKIMPNTKNEQHDEIFLAYMDSTIRVAENLYKKYPPYKIEAAFFWLRLMGLKDGCIQMSTAGSGARRLLPERVPWIIWRCASKVSI